MLRLVPILVIVVLSAAILWAAGQADIIESFSRVAADPWGLVALIDLYAGFALAIVVVAILEPRTAVTVAVALLVPVLGNLVPAVWLLVRLPMLVRLARTAADAA
jgi:hypothetical protein